MAGNNYMAMPPVFSGENYQIWAIRMKAFLQANDLCDLVETGEIAPLPEDPTVAQIKNQRKERRRMYKAKTCIFSAVSEVIFTKIITCETTKHAWDLLKQESQGNTRSKHIQILNLRREFEIQKMKEGEKFRDYAGRLMQTIKEIRLLGEELPDKRVVEKIIVTLPERFELKISSLEE